MSNNVYKFPGALCVGRKLGQQVVIGNDITITIAYIANGQVGLRIKADGLRIVRSEILSKSPVVYAA
jgi:sRNA-binding carbon storage regulator CsrA